MGLRDAERAGYRLLRGALGAEGVDGGEDVGRGGPRPVRAAAPVDDAPHRAAHFDPGGKPTSAPFTTRATMPFCARPRMTRA